MKQKYYDIIFNAVNITFLVLLALICTYPFYYIFIYSISDPIEAGKGILFVPTGITLQNYIDIMKQPDIFRAAIVSIGRAIIGTTITIFCSSFLAYLVTKKELPGRKFIYRFVIITMYISSGLIPWYILMKALGLKDTFFMYIIPSAVSAFYIILIKTYIESIPSSFEESASLDGAGIFTIYSRIIIPLSLPIITTCTVFAAVGQWNAWYDNFILVRPAHLKTLQLVLLDYLNQSMTSMVGLSKAATLDASQLIRSAMSIRMTISVVVILPIFIVYPLLQRYFIKGIMLGAIKG